MAGDAIYTELIVLKLKDETEAAMATSVQRFQGSADQIRSSLARVGPVAAEISELAGGKFELSWKAAFAMWEAGVKAEKEALKELQAFRIANDKEALRSAREEAAAMAAVWRAETQQQTDEAKQAEAIYSFAAKRKAAEAREAAAAQIAAAKEAAAVEADEAKQSEAVYRFAAQRKAEAARIAAAEEIAASRAAREASEADSRQEEAVFRFARRREVEAARAAALEEAAAAKERQAASRNSGMRSAAVVGAATVGGYELWEQVKAAGEMDKALHDMGTLLTDARTPAAEFNQILKETGLMAQGVSERFNLDVLGVIKGYKEALSSGWNADELKGMGESAGEMARAIHGSFDDAASVMSTYRFSQHLTAQETEKEAGDAVFNLVNIAKKLDFPEFQRSLGGLLIVAHAAGQSFRDVGAGLTVLTNNGLLTAPAATSLTNVMVRLSTMTGKVKEEFLGMSRAAGLADDVWDTHKHGIVELMNTVHQVTGGNIELIKKLFPEQRMLRGTEAMTQNLGALGKAYVDMGEKATASMAASRSMDNAFDHVEAGWKRITNATKEALLTAADYWVKGKTLDPADRKRGDDKAEDNYARYGNLYATDQTMDEHRKGIAGGSDNSNNLDRDFARRIREEEGFAARVKAVGDYQSKLEFAAKKTAEAHEESAKALEKSKEDAEAQAKAALAEFETRKATEKLTTEMSKPGKNDAMHVMGGWLGKAAEGVLAASGMPDLQQIKDAYEHAKEIGKEYLKRQADLGKELGQEMLAIYAADAAAKKHFEEEKLNAAKAVNAEMKRDLEALAGLQTSLNERMFQHGMAHAGHGGKDPARAARFAQNQLEEQEGKINSAITGGKLSEKDFAHMIDEFRKTGDARGTALVANKDGDRADREARERDGVEQGMIAAFRKMDTDRAAGSVDAINKKVFKAKTKDEVAAEAKQKTEGKHVDQNVNMNVALNLQGITTSQIQGMVKDMLTGALKDIQARGTGITGRPTTSRGAPVGQRSFSGVNPDDGGDDE